MFYQPVLILHLTRSSRIFHLPSPHILNTPGIAGAGLQVLNPQNPQGNSNLIKPNGRVQNMSQNKHQTSSKSTWTTALA